METCSRCYGLGYEEYCEDETNYRMVTDTCYHCGGSGKVDDECAFQDRLGDVSYALASNTIHDWIESANSDPDGEGWGFRAAENMMSEYEYTQSMIWTYQDKYMNDLLNMDRASQELMVAWNEYKG